MREKCLNPDCESGAYIRGLCQNCYYTAFGLVKRGKTTWEKLVESGKATKAGLIRSGRTKWFLEV